MVCGRAIPHAVLFVGTNVAFIRCYSLSLSLCNVLLMIAGPLKVYTGLCVTVRGEMKGGGTGRGCCSGGGWVGS